MAKANELKYCARVMTEPKVKTVGTKTVTEWAVSLYAGKNADGSYKKSPLLACKMWKDNPPTKGSTIEMVGRIGGESWGQAGQEQTKIVFNVDSWALEGQNPQATPQTEPSDDSELPF